MVTEYMAYRLLQGYRINRDIKQALNSFDFYIFPVVNPDGFVYTQTTNRMWRKNRQTQKGTACVGRDLNRNWDVHWNQTGAASTKPCRPTYKGLKPLDAPETRALAAELKAIKQQQGLRLFVDWHAFGQLVMYPYGHSCDKKLPPFSAASWLAGELAEAMTAVHGTRYRAGTACGLLYPTSGDSADYAFEVLGADYAYAVELRPGVGGRGGFRLPEGQILATAEEAWGGIRHVLKLIHH
ncbi:peptidase M14, carboxypeptidase A [Parathielavia hyrcaniae]|uniref:Peptidase M14, carboxypeptidase A n=1 Tax=Parathielavia hyrcaniae TaxID=113614 RepID=A0AAN6PYC0_9PEZI|nr:peptidase M14, carboxypeptidase A [Parathielavia hyrcaniae]